MLFCLLKRAPLPKPLRNRVNSFERKPPNNTYLQNRSSELEEGFVKTWPTDRNPIVIRKTIVEDEEIVEENLNVNLKIFNKELVLKCKY